MSLTVLRNVKCEIIEIFLQFKYNDLSSATSNSDICNLFAKHFSSVFVDPSTFKVPLDVGLSYTPSDTP